MTRNRRVGTGARVADGFAAGQRGIGDAAGHRGGSSYAATVVRRRVQVGRTPRAGGDLHPAVLRPVWRSSAARETVFSSAAGHIRRQGTCGRTECDATVPVRRPLRRRGQTQDGFAILRGIVRSSARVSAGSAAALDSRVHLARARRQRAAKADTLALRDPARTLDHVGPHAARSRAEESGRVRAASHGRSARAAVGRGRRRRVLCRCLDEARCRGTAVLGRCACRGLASADGGADPVPEEDEHATAANTAAAEKATTRRRRSRMPMRAARSLRSARTVVQA